MAVSELNSSSDPYKNADAETSLNRIIHGDNLEALKSLLPEFEGQVKCIYIDPPYNTGNEEWRYNDAVNDPKMKKWLGQYVGKEDLSRHDKWLCMMYPRLKLLHRLLKQDGVIFVSIDRNEMANLKAVLDEIFVATNWVGEIAWRNVTDNNPTNISLEHEYILCYAKHKPSLAPVWKSDHLSVKSKLVEIGEKFVLDYPDQKKRQSAYKEWFTNHKDQLWPLDRYKYIDEGGIYTGSQSVHNPGKEGYRYDVIHDKTGLPCKQPLMGYRFPQDTMEKLLADKRILFGKDESKLIELKLYAKDYKAKLPSIIELDGRTGTNEVKNIFPESSRPFDYPKPSILISDLIEFATEEGDLVLDSFAGSGTTGHAILKLNSEGGNPRQFILIETMDYAETITAERVRRVICGYGEGNKAVAGLGGSFDYYTVGERLLLDDGMLNAAVGLPAIRDYVAWTEGISIGQCAPLVPTATEGNASSPSWLGEAHGLGLFFVWDDTNPTTLDLSLLTQLVKRTGRYLIYADQCALGEDFMRRHNIVYKKIPRDITRL